MLPTRREKAHAWGMDQRRSFPFFAAMEDIPGQKKSYLLCRVSVYMFRKEKNLRKDECVTMFHVPFDVQKDF